MAEKYIEVKHASVLYENKYLGIKDFNLDFYSGEFISLIGANGSGKTTFINALCGFLPLTKGDISYNSEIIDLEKPFENIGWTKQTNAIDWYLNVEDNVKIGAELANTKNQNFQELVDEALKIVDLYNKKNVSVDALSGGQQQRVQIARALVHKPKILMLDEPTTGLDPKIAETVIKHLYNLSRNGCLIIASSHDLSLMENFCDKILLIKNGEIVTFEDTDLFMNNFNKRKIVKISFKGKLDNRFINNLPSSYKIIAGEPLIMDVPKEETLENILNSLNNSIEIIDFQQSSPGLREVYLDFSNRGDEE